MKLATLNDDTRDGRLVVVSRDLSACAPAPELARNLQRALDDWPLVEPHLRGLYDELNNGKIAGTMDFVPAECRSPLPRAYQWADGSAYVNHVALVRRARGADMPDSFWTDPLMYQGGSDGFLDPHGDIPLADPSWGCDLEAEIAVVTSDVAAGTDAHRALGSVRLLMLVNDVSLRGLIPGELAKGFGFFQAKPASAFSPVAVTPDELGEAWREGKLHGALQSWVNGQLLGRPDAGADMSFDFGQLIAHAARTRSLVAGSIIGSGTVSNRDAEGGPGLPIAEGGLGYSCLAEQRSVEVLRHGAARSPFLRAGDRVRIEMLDAHGHSIFGAIDQRVVAA